MKILQRDWKTVNVDPKQILKKSLYRKRKNENSRDNSDTWYESIVEGVVQKWLVFIRFIREKLEEGREFRSEDLQKGNKERQARKRQQQAHYTKQVNASLAKSGNPNLVTIAGPRFGSKEVYFK